VNPRAAKGPRTPPTRRSARWLTGVGLFVTLFSAIGISTAVGGKYESEDATIIGKYAVETGSATLGEFQKVRLRLADGSIRAIPNAPLYDAIGHRFGQHATVDIKRKTGAIKAVHWNGRRYGATSPVAGVVITILFTAIGAFVLVRGIGRWRRARYAESTASSQ
jgi:hypothetical protein